MPTNLLGSWLIYQNLGKCWEIVGEYFWRYVVFVSILYARLLCC